MKYLNKELVASKRQCMSMCSCRWEHLGVWHKCHITAFSLTASVILIGSTVMMYSLYETEQLWFLIISQIYARLQIIFYSQISYFQILSWRVSWKELVLVKGYKNMNFLERVSQFKLSKLAHDTSDVHNIILHACWTGFFLWTNVTFSSFADLLCSDY